MLSRVSKVLLTSLCLFSLTLSCGGKDKKKKDGDTDNDGGANAKFSGKVTEVAVTAFHFASKTRVDKTITHIVAVSPSSGNTKRYVAEVNQDNGEFSLNIQSGKPYILVFVAQDGTLEGADMIAGIVKVASNDLDAFAVTSDTEVDMGDVTVNASSSLATMSTSLPTLLSSLGITSAEAAYIGAVDDLALRLANPDIDSNGVIDATENKNFGLDWHIRANTKLSGIDMVLDDVENDFAAEADVSLDWTLGSAYAVYPKTHDDVTYPQSPGVNATLINGGAFSHVGTSITPTSMSAVTFGDMRSWGPDYNMSTQELGASNSAATFVYTLGSPSKTLTFTNVRTKEKAELNADGVLLPFIKINTAAGKFAGIGYKWMKRQGSAWVAATADEVALLVQGESAQLNLYTQKGGVPAAGDTKAVYIHIPTSPETGTLAIGSEKMSADGISSIADLTLTDFCSSAMSYDDNIGLRIFAGAPMPNVGVTACP